MIGRGANLTEAGVRLAHGLVLARHAGGQLALPRVHAQEGAAGLPGVGALRKGSLQQDARLSLACMPQPSSTTVACLHAVSCSHLTGGLS